MKTINVRSLIRSVSSMTFWMQHNMSASSTSEPSLFIRQFNFKLLSDSVQKNYQQYRSVLYCGNDTGLAIIYIHRMWSLCLLCATQHQFSQLCFHLVMSECVMPCEANYKQVGAIAPPPHAHKHTHTHTQTKCK